MVEVNIDADIILRVGQREKIYFHYKNCHKRVNVLPLFFVSIQLRFLNNQLHTRTIHITDEKRDGKLGIIHWQYAKLPLF